MKINDRENSNSMFENKVIKVSFLLSILVLYIHSNNLAYYGLDNKYSEWPYKVITLIGKGFGEIAVPMFLVISGYLFFLGVDVNKNSLHNIIKEKQLRRIKSILIPYLLWNLFGTIFYMTIPRIPVIDSIMNGSFVEISLSNIFIGIFFHRYYFPLWYLETLIVLVILAPLFGILLKNYHVGLLVLIILFISHILKINIPIISPASIFFYFSGCLLAVLNKQLFQKKYKIKYSIVAMTIFFLFCYLRTFKNWGIVNSITYLISPFILWIAVDLMVNFRKVFWFEKQSFFIYCSHIIIVSSIGRVFFKFSYINYTYEWVIISYFSVPIISLLIIYLLARLLNEYCKRFYRIICGNRG